MNKRKWMWVIAGFIILVGLVISNILSRQKEPMRLKPGNSRPKTINTILVQNKEITLPIEISGPLYAYEKVELYAEVSGVLLNTPKHFKAGIPFKKGEVLIAVDDGVFKNNVLAQKSSLLNQLTLLLPDLAIDFPDTSHLWEDYLKNLDLQKELKPLPVPASDKERYYIAARNIYNQYYTIKSLETTLSKYTLRAPFDGVVTVSAINPGTLVRSGQKLGEFINTSIYEMEAAVSLFDANRLEIGQTVSLTTEDLPETFTGYIRRINRILDTTSLTVKVYIHLQDPQLREGMYMIGKTEGRPIANAVVVSKDLLVDNNRLFAVDNSVLVLKPVRVVAERGDKAIVRGLKDGTRILGEVWAEAREGLEFPDTSQNLPNSPNEETAQRPGSAPNRVSPQPPPAG